MAKIDFDKMTYREIEQRYIDNNIEGHYRFRNADEVKSVFGWDFRTIRGMKTLSSEDKELAERLICNYLNSWGLGQRHKQRPSSIKKDKQRFIVKFHYGGYSYLSFSGSIY